MPASIIAVANQKGGVGKTTTAVNLGTALAQSGRRVLLVDCDPQANATSGLGIEGAGLEISIYDVLVLGRPLAEAIMGTQVASLHLLPATINLAGSEIELIDLPRSRQRLQYALDGAVDAYDYVLIDCPPSLGLLAINAVVAAESLLVPVQCEYYALEGLGLLRHTIDLLRRDLNPGLTVAGMVMTLFDSRLALAWQVVAEVKRRFPGELLETVIPRNVRLSEAPSHGLPVALYDPSCRGALAYRELAIELDARIRCTSAAVTPPDTGGALAAVAQSADGV